MLWALVPVKQLAQSKQRLSRVLDQDERKGLVLAMLNDVLTAIQSVHEFYGILVVSRSSEAIAIARQFGMETFSESAGSDHSRAVTEASQYVFSGYQAKSTLALPGDVPLVTADDIRQVIAQHEYVTLVPNQSCEGTNAVMASPPNAISYHFGKGSLRRHIASADDAGISASIVRNENLARDIDEPCDLVHTLNDLPPSFTRNYLESSGIAAHLNNRNLSRPADSFRKPNTTDRWA